MKILGIGTPRILKKLAPKGLLGRSLLIIVLPLILVQAVSAYVFYDRHWDTMTRRLSNSVAGDIATVIAFLDRSAGDQEDWAWMFRQAHIGMQLVVNWDKGGVLPNEPPPESGAYFLSFLDKALTEQVRRPFRVDAETWERQVEVAVQLPDGVLWVMVPRKRLFSSTTYIWVLWMVGTSLLFAGVAIMFMRIQVRSVRRLAVAADALGKGHDVTGFKLEGAAEVRRAGQAFQRMRDRIRRQIDQRTEMLAGVSHDLRTPLTRMKLELALLGDGAGAEDLKQDVAEMERMIEGYLAFARGEGTEGLSETNLAELLDLVVRGFRRQGKAVDLHCERDLVAPLRQHAFERALTNLIGNAVRYAEHVSVRAGQRGQGGGSVAEIVIDDDGPGIPEDKRADVFRPFVRLEGSRNVKTGGTGLGLTIARDVVRSQGGEITLEDSPLGGLRVRVVVPL